MERPLLPGVIAQQAPADGSYSVRWLLLTRPEKKGGRFYLAIHRTDGKPVLFGSGTQQGRELQFEVRAVEERGNPPVLVRGRANGDGSLEFYEALSALTRLPSGGPRPMEPPQLR